MTGRKIKLSLLAKPKSTLFYERFYENLDFHNLTISKLLILLVGTAGFEPATPCPPDGTAQGYLAIKSISCIASRLKLMPLTPALFPTLLASDVTKSPHHPQMQIINN